MRQLNPEHIPRLIPLINQGPFFRLLNMRLVELGWGYAVVQMELAGKHLNPFGGVHGGSYTSLIDTAAYWSTYCQMDSGAGFVTVDVNVNIVGAANGQGLLSRARCIKTGRTMCLAEASAWDQEGRLIAQGTSKMLAIAGMQTIDQVVQAVGGEPLPPKFLD